MSMYAKFPKNDAKYAWTNHVCHKMRFYQLSESRVKKVIRHPKRVEKGIAPNTIACMQPGTSKKRPEEIWVMYQTRNQKLKSKSQKFGDSKIIIISAWRYPGVSPAGKAIHIPEDVLEDLRNYTVQWTGYLCFL